jgi:hypothetical protein
MKKIPLSVRIIHILTLIVYYLTIVTFSLVILWSLAIFTGILDTDLQLHIKMPVEVNFNETGTGVFLSTPVDVEIVEAVGKVHLINTPWKVARILMVPLLVIFPFLFWIVHQFYRFIINVKNGHVFADKNFRYLKKIGFGLIGLWLVMVIYMQLLYHTTVKFFRFENVEITSNNLWFEEFLIAGVFTLVLSHVFFRGREIEAENELTI